MANKKLKARKVSLSTRSSRNAKVRWNQTKKIGQVTSESMGLLGQSLEYVRSLPENGPIFNCNVENEETIQNTGAGKCSSSQEMDIPTYTEVYEDEGSNHSDSNLYTETCTSNENKSMGLGRRFVDVAYFFKQIREISSHGAFQCSVEHMQIIEEKKNGLRSTFILQCEMCKTVKEIHTDPENNFKNFNVNTAAVLGMVSIGCGFSQMEELLATLDVPSISNRLYTKEHDNVADIINMTALNLMKEAAAEEAVLAKQLGNVDKDGHPMITVISDASWCTRSYNRNYASSSGVGCIIGEATGKLLFLGIRNKYCALCALADSKKEFPKEHTCFKNYKGSTTSMEADIIAEGFQRSIEMHGLVYHRLVGDGDSSVSKKLIESKPYGPLLVQKVECCNHLLRNYCNKLKDLTKTCRLGDKYVPVKLRKQLESNILRLRVAITKAAEKRRTENASLDEKINLLSKDILNSPSHIFGQHEKCREIGYFCEGPKDNEENLVPEMIQYGLYQEIKKYLYRLVQNSSSLILNMTNNAAEHYNSIVAKFTGGKRINFAKRGSYQTRCEAAAVSLNCNEEYLSKIYKTATERSPSCNIKKYITKRKLKRLRETRRRLFRSRITKKYKKHESADEHYGNVDSDIDDMPANEYTAKKDTFLEGIKKSVEEIQTIEKLTRGQSANPIWKQERSYRITASEFGNICKLRKNTSCENTVKRLLYNNFHGNEVTRYGIESEPIARKCFEEIKNLTVKECGLFIGHNDEYFLGASPDGIIEDEDALIEIKCPKSISEMAPLDAAKNKKITFLTYDAMKDVACLKATHNYMYQIQGQLHISQKNKCYFVVWTPVDLYIEEIVRDQQFWEEKMWPKLKCFYFTCLLPEIIDPRYPKKHKIRNPERHIL